MARIDFEVEQQEHSNWCWAAVSISVHKFFNTSSTRRQCGMAGELLNLPCCENFTEECDSPKSLTTALEHLDRLKAVKERVVTFDEIQREIDAGCPVCVRFEWTVGAGRGNGHFAVICGYDVTAGGPVVIVEDPFYGHSRRPYARITTTYQFGRGKWTHSYLVKGTA